MEDNTPLTHWHYAHEEPSLFLYSHELNWTFLLLIIVENLRRNWRIFNFYNFSIVIKNIL